MAHRHKARPGWRQDRGWMHCITPTECAASPRRQAAHGNITVIDTCSCGATRHSERNLNQTNYGPWLEKAK